MDSSSEMSSKSKRSSISAKGVFQSAAFAPASSMLRSRSSTTPASSAESLLALALVSTESRKMRIDRSSVLFSSGSSRSAAFFSALSSTLLKDPEAATTGGLPSLMADTTASTKGAPRSPSALIASSSTAATRSFVRAKRSGGAIVRAFSC